MLGVVAVPATAVQDDRIHQSGGFGGILKGHERCENVWMCCKSNMPMKYEKTSEHIQSMNFCQIFIFNINPLTSLLAKYD